MTCCAIGMFGSVFFCDPPPRSHLAMMNPPNAGAPTAKEGPENASSSSVAPCPADELDKAKRTAVAADIDRSCGSPKRRCVSRGRSPGAGSDGGLSTTRQFSDDSENEDVFMINCHFKNGITGDLYFTKALNYHDKMMSVVYLFSLVRQELGYDYRAFNLQVGVKVWSCEDIYGKFFLYEIVKDAVAASEFTEVFVQVTRVTTPEDSAPVA